MQEGILRAHVSVDIATADLKATLMPESGRRAASIIEALRELAAKGVEIRVLHSGVPSAPTLRLLKRKLPPTLALRRCPRVHAKLVVVDSARLYVGSANLTGAGLGAKSEDRRNFEIGVWTANTACIESALDYFNAIWEGHRCETCKRRDICPVPLEEPDLA